MRLCSVFCMAILLMTETVNSYHHHGIELFQTSHILEKNSDDTPSFNSFNCTTQKICCYRFKILKNQHSIRLTQNVFGVLIIAPTDFCTRYKQIKWIFAILIVQTTTNQLLNLSPSCLLVTKTLKSPNK